MRWLMPAALLLTGCAALDALIQHEGADGTSSLPVPIQPRQ
jgi:hypothetical protein